MNDQQDNRPELPEEMTVADAAAYLGMTPAAIRKANQQGRIAYRRLLNPRLALIARDEVLRYERERSPRTGRPPSTPPSA